MRYGFLFEYEREFMIILYDGVNKYSEKYFNSSEHYFDDSYDYMEMYLGDNGKLYKYKIDSYDELIRIIEEENNIDIFELRNEEIKELEEYLVK